MALGKKSQAQAILISERREQAINLRRAGLSLRDIAKRLSVDVATIHEDIKVMMAEAIKENVNNADQLRAMELERLDRMLLNISGQLAPVMAADGKTVLKPASLNAVNTALRISEQRSKLLGLFAPVQQKISVHHTWQDETIELIKSGRLTYSEALETFDHDDTLVRSLFAKAEIPVSTGQA